MYIKKTFVVSVKSTGTVEEDSGECSTRLRGMLKNIPGNVQQDYEEC